VSKFEKLKQIKVLYVEDEEDIRSEIVDMLSLKVQNVYVSINGQEGYDSYLKYKPDLIITDIKMPILDGMSMIRKIREVDSDIPIVITSAFENSDFLKESIELHVDKFITKPIDFNMLLYTLNEMKNFDKDRNEYWIKITIHPIFDENDKKIGYSSYRENITDKKKLEYISTHDTLTGIFNFLWNYSLSRW
jgi:YesN/AraC family two-component response regulator